MTIKERLIQEIESTEEALLAEALDFLQFLKSKTVQTATNSETIEILAHRPVKSTGNSLIEHLKTIGSWKGDDLKECLELVYTTRGKAKFHYDNHE